LKKGKGESSSLASININKVSPSTSITTYSPKNSPKTGSRETENSHPYDFGFKVQNNLHKFLNPKFLHFFYKKNSFCFPISKKSSIFAD